MPPSPDSRSARMPVERKTKDCSATAAAQPRKPASVASPIGPPPKPLPSSGGRLALTAFTIRLGGPSSSRTRASAAERASASLASAAIPSAPRSPTAATVSSLCAMAAPRQPFCWRWSITAPPRLRAPRTTATRSAFTASSTIARMIRAIPMPTPVMLSGVRLSAQKPGFALEAG